MAPLFIEPGSPWKNGDVESFNGKLRDELLNGELFYTLHEPSPRRTLAMSRQCIPPAKCAWVSTTGPRDPHSHTDQLIRVSRTEPVA